MIDPINRSAVQTHYMEMSGQRQVDRQAVPQQGRAAEVYGVMSQTRDAVQNNLDHHATQHANKSTKTRPQSVHKVECQTCKNRTYQDQSSDNGVSFKSPAHVSPASADAVIRPHEAEHVAIAQNKAIASGGKSVSTVQMQYSVCPECGRPYASGATTTTTTTTKSETARPSAAEALESIDAYA